MGKSAAQDRQEKEHYGHELALNLYALVYSAFFVTIILFPNLKNGMFGADSFANNAKTMSGFFSKQYIFSNASAIYLIISVASARFVLGSLFANHDSSFRKTLHKFRKDTYAREFVYTLTVIKLLMVFSLTRTYLLFYEGFSGTAQTALAGFIIISECCLIAKYDHKYRDVLFSKDPDRRYNLVILVADCAYILSGVTLFILAPVIYFVSSLICDTPYVISSIVIEILALFVAINFVAELIASYMESIWRACKGFGVCLRVLVGGELR